MKFIKIAIIVVLIVCFASCKDSNEPETLGYVVAIGIDGPEEGEEGYDITLQFANPDKISGGSGEAGGDGGEGSIENITVPAPDIYSAINIANHIISKKFVLSHTKLIVFSDEIAKKGIKNFLDSINRNPEIRPNIYFAVSKTSARAFLEAVNPKTEVNPVRYYTMLFENDYSGFIPQNMGQDFYLFYDSEEKSTVMPLCSVVNTEKGGEYPDYGYQYKVEDYTAGEIRENAGGVQIAGMALFRGDTKISETGDTKTEIFNLLTGEYQSSYVSYYFSKTPETPVTVMQTQKKRPKIAVSTKKAAPKIEVTLFLEADISSSEEAFLIESDIEAFSLEAENALKEQATAFFEETRALGVDIFGFGSYAKRNFATVDEFSAYNWKEAYKNAELEIKVELSVKRTGLLVRG